MTDAAQTPHELAKQLQDALPKTYEAIDAAMKARLGMSPMDEKMRHDAGRTKDMLRDVVDLIIHSQNLQSIEELPLRVSDYLRDFASRRLTVISAMPSGEEKWRKEQSFKELFTDTKLGFMIYAEQLGIRSQMSEALRTLPDLSKGDARET